VALNSKAAPIRGFYAAGGSSAGLVADKGRIAVRVAAKLAACA